jgi:hypothetical protein
MTNKQKQALAQMVLIELDTILEFWSEKIKHSDKREILEEISQEDLEKQLFTWFKNLPTGDMTINAFAKFYQ